MQVSEKTITCKGGSWNLDLISGGIETQLDDGVRANWHKAWNLDLISGGIETCWIVMVDPPLFEVFLGI